MNQKYSATIITVICVVFIVIWAGIIPYLVGNNGEHHDTRKDYCAKLAAQIASDKANHLNATILINEIQLYHDSCSG